MLRVGAYTFQDEKTTRTEEDTSMLTMEASTAIRLPQALQRNTGPKRLASESFGSFGPANVESTSHAPGKPLKRAYIPDWVLRVSSHAALNFIGRRHITLSWLAPCGRCLFFPSSLQGSFFVSGAINLEGRLCMGFLLGTASRAGKFRILF